MKGESAKSETQSQGEAGLQDRAREVDLCHGRRKEGSTLTRRKVAGSSAAWRTVREAARLSS